MNRGREREREKLNCELDRQVIAQRKYVVNSIRKLSLDSLFPGLLIRSSNASACSSSYSSGSGSNTFGEGVLKAGEPAPTCLDSSITSTYVFRQFDNQHQRV